MSAWIERDRNDRGTFHLYAKAKTLLAVNRYHAGAINADVLGMLIDKATFDVLYNEGAADDEAVEVDVTIRLASDVAAEDALRNLASIVIPAGEMENTGPMPPGVIQELAPPAELAGDGSGVPLPPVVSGNPERESPEAYASKDWPGGQPDETELAGR